MIQVGTRNDYSILIFFLKSKAELPLMLLTKLFPFICKPKHVGFSFLFFPNQIVFLLPSNQIVKKKLCFILSFPYGEAHVYSTYNRETQGDFLSGVSLIFFLKRLAHIKKFVLFDCLF